MSDYNYKGTIMITEGYLKIYFAKNSNFKIIAEQKHKLILKYEVNRKKDFRFSRVTENSIL